MKGQSYSTPPRREFRREERRRDDPGTAVLILLGLLMLPALAALRLARTFDPRWIFGYALAVSLLACLFNWRDKRRAQSGDWRISEATLHLLEIAGGWPGAFVAQRVLRHKTSKTTYQFTFWTIIVLHQMLALDYLLDWRYGRQVFAFLFR